MRSGASYRLLLLVGVLGVAAIFSSSIFVMLPAAVSNQQQLLQSVFATFPGENGKIAFISNRDSSFGNYDIYVMNADGSEQTRLTNILQGDVEPSWSPDGTKIAFRTDRHGPALNAEIYVMNADGSEQTRLTDNPAFDVTPSWSPDGTKIAFSSTRNDNQDIYVMNADGSNPTRLTDNSDSDVLPDWSPDGTKIAFRSNRNSNTDIYVMNADGSNPTRLTDSQGVDSEPSWSPDGTKIAFDSERDRRFSSEIYVMNADGSEQTRLTNTPGGNVQPSWSPDGTSIAFTSGRDGNAEIYVMNADGSEQTNVSNNSTNQGGDSQPSWGIASDGEPPADTTPPVLTVPEDKTARATTANGGTVVTYNVTAEDNVDGTAILEEDNTITQDDDGGAIDITCDPASGSEFPIGQTVVECSATDTAGNIGGPASFTVTVNSPLPPPPPDSLTADISSSTTEGDAPLAVEFEAIVTGGTPPYTYSWDFGDGTTEEESIEQTALHTYDEPGVYTVTLTVTDANGQQESDTFQVTVNETPPPPPPTPNPAEATEELISDIQNLEGVSQGTKTSLTAPLRGAVNILNDDNPNNDNSACGRFGAFINQVNASERRGSLTAVQADDLRTQAEVIRDMLDC